MKIFLSYPSNEKSIAEEISLALIGNNHKVFFDRSSLHEGEEYHNQIRKEIQTSSVMIFLITPKSISKGYTLSELEIAKTKWKNPSSHLLPVMLHETPQSDVPPYLGAVNILYPKGNVAAEVAAKVEILFSRVRQRRIKLAALAFGALLTVLFVLFFVFDYFQSDSHRNTQVFLPQESDRRNLIPIVNAIKKSDLEAMVREEIVRLLDDKDNPFRDQIEAAKGAIFETAESLDSKKFGQDIVSIRDVNAQYGNGEQSKWVIFIPDIMQSELANVANRNTEVVWLNMPSIVQGSLIKLKLAPFDGLSDKEATQDVKIKATGLLKGVYDLLLGSLIIEGYSLISFPYDWTKDFDFSAYELAKILNDKRFTRNAGNYIIAHGAGALIARRALQILGAERSRAIIRHLVLLAPINCGAFNSVQLLEGSSSFLKQLAYLDFVHSKQELLSVFASFPAIYQLLPWDDETLRYSRLDQKESWGNAPIDDLRLQRYWGWGRLVNTKFFDDRTTAFLGYGNYTTVSRSGSGDQTVFQVSLNGDGVVKTSCSTVQGAANYFVELNHYAIPSSKEVIKATVEVFKGINPDLPTEPGVVR